MVKNIEKDGALDQVLRDIEKQFGKGAIMKLGDQEKKEIDVCSSGSISLDIALWYPYHSPPEDRPCSRAPDLIFVNAECMHYRQIFSPALALRC